MIEILTIENSELMNKDVLSFSSDLEKLVLENLLNRDLSVKWLARQMFYSERQMYRLVKKYTGKTVNEYIRDVRLEQAKILLERKNCMVKEAASQVGYRKVSWFSAQYFLRFGKRPKEVDN